MGKIKILRVVFNMSMGGVPISLINLLKKMDKAKYQTDFVYVEPGSDSCLDNIISSLGANIYFCYKGNYFRFASNFRKILIEKGPYDIVHCHLVLFSGVVLRIAHQVGVPVRVAHGHSDYSILMRERSKVLFYINRYLIDRHATLKLAISKKAALSYYGADCFNDRRVKLLLQGRDFSAYQKTEDSKNIRNELGIPLNMFVIGHIGRFSNEKNHRFLLKIVKEYSRLGFEYKLILVGEGLLREDIQQKAKEIGIAENILFLGNRSDIPSILCGVIDVLVFPSLYEGLGMVLVEAQAAGVSCVYSDVIPEEVDLVKSLMHRISLDSSPQQWADIIHALRNYDKNNKETLQIVLKSGFNIDSQADILEKYYSEGVSEAINADSECKLR